MGLIYTNPQKFNSGIHLNGATPLDDRLQINDISDIYISNTTTGTAGCAIYGMAYDGMVISVVDPSHNHSKDVILIQLKDATPYKYGFPGEVNKNNYTEYWTVSASGNVSFDTSVIDASINNLENSILTLNSSVNILDSDINNIQTDITSIKQKNISQDSSLNTLDSSIRDILTDITSIKQKNISQDSSLNTFDSSIRDLYNKPETQTSPVYLKDGQSGYVLGDSNNAPGENAFAEGVSTTAFGESSHAEGGGSIASGNFSHVEGLYTIASGDYSHAEGYDTSALGSYSHTEGYSTTASGDYSHTEGYYTYAQNDAEHASGKYNKSTYDVTLFSVGIGTADNARVNAFEIDTNGKVYVKGVGNYDGTNIGGQDVKALGDSGWATVNYADVSSAPIRVEGDYINHSWSLGRGVIGTEEYHNISDAFAVGRNAQALEDYAFATGYNTVASGTASFVSGKETTAAGIYSHAEGHYAHASGESSHAEGESSNALGKYSHAEGRSSKASGESSHAEGGNTTASAKHSHAEGYYTNALGVNSHAEGLYTQTRNANEHAEGKYNLSTPNVTLSSVGCGHEVPYSPDVRMNAFEIDVNGNVYIKGIGDYDGTNITGTGVKSVQEVIAELAQQITTLQGGGNNS